MMIDITKKYETRDGDPVRIYSTSGALSSSTHGAIKYHGGWFSCSWNEKGIYDCTSNGSGKDLVEVLPRIQRTVWLAVYEGGTYLHDTKELAEAMRSADRRALILVDIDCVAGKGQ